MTPRRFRPLGLAITAVITLGLFGPSWLAGGRLGREYVDGYGTLWYYAHVADALAAGRSPLAATELFHPWGKDLVRSAGGNVLDAVVAAPLGWALGPTWGYNALILAAHAGAAVLIFRLARALTGDRLAAGLAAGLFATDVWVLQELALGRPTQGLLVGLVWFVAELVALHRRPRARHALAAGVALALLGYQYWYYGLFAGMAAVAWGLVSIGAPGPRFARAGGYAVAAILALALVAPLALPLVRAAADGSAPGRLDVARWTWTATPAVTATGEYVNLVHWQPLVGWHGALANVDLGGESFLRTLWQPGWGVGVALVALVVGRSRLPRGPTSAAAAIALLVAVGPVLVVARWGVPNLAYIGLAELWPVWQRLWWPDRAYAILAVFVPLAMAGGVASLRGRPGLRAAAVAVAMGASLAAVRAADLWPFPTWKPSVEAGYRCLAHATEGAVVELPWSWSQRHLVAQTVHGRPILGGMNERDPSFAPAELRALAAVDPAVADLVTPYARSGTPLREWGPADLGALGALGYRWIVVQLDALAPAAGHPGGRERALALERYGALRRRLGDPVYEDARLVIWAPWGHGSPCAGAEPEPDRRALGRTETSLDLHDDLVLPLAGARRWAEW